MTNEQAIRAAVKTSIERDCIGVAVIEGNFLDALPAIREHAEPEGLEIFYSEENDGSVDVTAGPPASEETVWRINVRAERWRAFQAGEDLDALEPVN